MVLGAESESIHNDLPLVKYQVSIQHGYKSRISPSEILGGYSDGNLLNTDKLTMAR